MWADDEDIERLKVSEFKYPRVKEGHRVSWRDCSTASSIGVAGTAPVQTLSLPRLMMRPGVADAVSFCLRGIPAARRSSREGTIRLEASSSMLVFKT
jgi:hypothetical protein